MKLKNKEFFGVRAGIPLRFVVVYMQIRTFLGSIAFSISKSFRWIPRIIRRYGLSFHWLWIKLRLSKN